MVNDRGRWKCPLAGRLHFPDKGLSWTAVECTKNDKAVENAEPQTEPAFGQFLSTSNREGFPERLALTRHGEGLGGYFGCRFESFC